MDEYQVTARNLKKYQALESEVLQSCDRVIATSPSMPSQLQSFDAKKFLAITNGFDKSDFKSFEDKSESNKLVVYHAGLMSALRNPTNFWKALDQLLAENLIDKDKFELNLAGVVESVVDDSINELEHLSTNYSKEGYKKHEEVIKDYETANVLLLFVNNTANAAVNIPGKTFEYLATGKPILCFSDLSTDVAKILNSFNHCLVVDYNLSVSELKKELLVFFSKRATSASHELNQYSRSHLTSVLAKLLDNP